MQTDLVGFSDAPDLNLRFLAMLAGPFYPILHLVNERLVYLACYLSSFVSFCTEHFTLKITVDASFLFLGSLGENSPSFL